MAFKAIISLCPHLLRKHPDQLPGSLNCGLRPHTLPCSTPLGKQIVSSNCYRTPNRLIVFPINNEARSFGGPGNGKDGVKIILKLR